MPLFTIQIFKHLSSTPDREWTNVYHVFRSGIPEAEDDAQAIATMEQSIHQGVVQFSRARVSTTVEGDSVFSVVPLGFAGAGAGSDLLPLFNTVRVDVLTSNLGRPDRKYYRLPIDEGGQTNGVLTSAVQSTVQSAVQSLIDDLNATEGVLVAADTGIWQTATVITAVQMRQLHRRRRRAPAP